MNAGRVERGGFTLIEVLVALAVVAIALGALLGAAGQGARSAAHLREHTAALWVADNRATELQLAGVAPSTELRGEADMLGRTWYWVQRAESGATGELLRVRVSVHDRPPAPGVAAAPLLELSVFVAPAS